MDEIVRVANVVSGLNAPTVCDNDELEREKRRYYVQQCVSILKQAISIRRDRGLMLEITAYIRAEKDALADLLDEVHAAPTRWEP